MLLSRALKYNVRIKPRLYRFTFVSLMELIFLGSVWTWQFNWFTGQEWIQLLLTLCVLLHWFQSYRHQLHHAVSVTLSEDGRWVFAPQTKLASSAIKHGHKHSHYSGLPRGEPLRLSRYSKATSWLLWIHIKYNKKQHWFWVFRDEVSDHDYRRLCLAIRYCQHHNVT
ncbi:protein YgfX [Alteromonas sp. a30]|uniref:protein YgfX n=1 Tax=Alteromonas sp. a30 TaxID=2730917 RepID=UPI00227E8C0B|nr:protein YgfX [Alteromonas sp. a30]MCY7296612.1 hypothetical protein [Alteromonas sp. a30]